MFRKKVYDLVFKGQFRIYLKSGLLLMMLILVEGLHIKRNDCLWCATKVSDYWYNRPLAGYRPPSPQGEFVHYDFLKQHYIRHK